MNFALLDSRHASGKSLHLVFTIDDMKIKVLEHGLQPNIKESSRLEYWKNSKGEIEKIISDKGDSFSRFSAYYFLYFYGNFNPKIIDKQKNDKADFLKLYKTERQIFVEREFLIFHQFEKIGNILYQKCPHIMKDWDNSIYHATL